jgi:hypothetical protein
VLSEFVNLSVLILTRVNCALAGVTSTREIEAAKTAVRKANAFRFIGFFSGD